MPAADTVLLPLCVGLTLLGVLVTAFVWRRGNKGRVVQGVGLALAPIALYFSGLLRLLWDGAVAVGHWAAHVVLSPTIWFGLGLLGLCVVLWAVGGLVARRFPAKKKQRSSAASRSSTAPAAVTGSTQAGAGAGKTRGVSKRTGSSAPPVDDDLAEIEALLKSRGIN